MTGFARAEHTAGWGHAQWEVRALNNRYLDAFAKLPEDLRHLEPEVRDRMRRRLGRGKVEASLKISYSPNHTAGFTIDHGLASRLIDACREIGDRLDGPCAVSPVELLRWPGVIQTAPIDLEIVATGALCALDAALEDLVASRLREGEKIADFLGERLDETDGHVSQVRSHLPAILDAVRAKLVSRLSELAEQLDPERLEQEMVIAVQKSDVAEELDRLETHTVEIRRVLGSNQPVGRRLDFLMQELNREANTLGSKSMSTLTTQASVELKVLIEQMREQVQNIE